MQAGMLACSGDSPSSQDYGVTLAIRDALRDRKDVMFPKRKLFRCFFHNHKKVRRKVGTMSSPDPFMWQNHLMTMVNTCLFCVLCHCTGAFAFEFGSAWVNIVILSWARHPSSFSWVFKWTSVLRHCSLGTYSQQLVTAITNKIHANSGFES